MRFGPDGATIGPPVLAAPTVSGTLEAVAAIGPHAERTLLFLSPQTETTRSGTSRRAERRCNSLLSTSHGAVWRRGDLTVIRGAMATATPRASSARENRWSSRGVPPGIKQVNLARIVP